MNSLIELMQQRRSIRKFEDRSIEREKLDLVVKAALMAPSSKRCTPWHFIVVEDKDLLKSMSESRIMGSSFVSGASAAILVLAETEKSDVWVEDASIAATHMLLEAYDLGLGGCWVQVRNRMKDDNVSTESYLRNLLGFPENLSAECIIALGYKAEEKKPFDEEHILKDRVHFNKF